MNNNSLKFFIVIAFMALGVRSLAAHATENNFEKIVAKSDITGVFTIVDSELLENHKNDQFLSCGINYTVYANEITKGNMQPNERIKVYSIRPLKTGRKYFLVFSNQHNEKKHENLECVENRNNKKINLALEYQFEGEATRINKYNRGILLVEDPDLIFPDSILVEKRKNKLCEMDSYGELNCKLYDIDHYIYWDDLSSFISESADVN